MAPLEKRRLFIGGNWKCNGTPSSVQELTETLNQFQYAENSVQVVVFPPHLFVPYVKDRLTTNGIQCGVQNIGMNPLNGAFTGEISALMVKSIGISWTLTGHSERRMYNHETNQVVAEKSAHALNHQLQVVVCVGESLKDRQSNLTLPVVFQQLDALLPQIKNWENVVIAYEPVWAIGTGLTASPQQAQEVHAAIREWLGLHVSPQTALHTRIIYGGSVNSKNSHELIQQKDIDGFLVGGASLKKEFLDIIQNANACSKM